MVGTHRCKTAASHLKRPLEARGFPVTDLRSVPAEYQDEHVRSSCFQSGATSVVQVGAGWVLEMLCHFRVLLAGWLYHEACENVQSALGPDFAEESLTWLFPKGTVAIVGW